MIQVSQSQNLDALIDEIRSIAEELEEEGECDAVVLTRLESVAFNLETLAHSERIPQRLISRKAKGE
jgi:hypothetical protein